MLDENLKSVNKWGFIILGYAFIWIIIFITALLSTSKMVPLLYSGIGEVAGFTLWFTACAGGLGGTVGVVYSIFYQAFMKGDLKLKYIFDYLGQPIIGFVLGLTMYLLIYSMFLTIDFILNLDNSPFLSEMLRGQVPISLLIVFGWVAGFRQKYIVYKIKKVLRAKF